MSKTVQFKNGDVESLRRQLDKTQEQLRRAETTLTISQRVAGKESLTEILWLLIDLTVKELGAERGSLFLNDATTEELYSRIAQGDLTREIRLLNTTGIAGAVFQSGVGEIIHRPYEDERFNSQIDEQTGYVTKNIVCAPILSARRETIGVIQILNKNKGRFRKIDLEILEAICSQAAVSLQNAQGIEEMERSRDKELKFLDVVSDVTAEIELANLLQRVMQEACHML
ncbi:MAG: GAF domain-containing protein, partial [Pseudomonadota bacterium]|nr:GAF domain-containing protein [Pseudomonadota bacterium]